MVISYSIEELMAIGELVTLRECLAPNNNNTLQLSNNNRSLANQQHQQQQLNHSLNLINSLCCQINSQLIQSHQHQNQLNNHQQQHQQLDCLPSPGDEKQLAQSVVDFFRLAQQNFYKTIIDPTKVKSLSEVEAELLPSSPFNL